MDADQLMAVRSILASPTDHNELPTDGFETSPVRAFGEVSNLLLERIEEKLQKVVERGTQPAIEYSNSGVPADLAKRSQRGGAHNSAARQSYALTQAQIANLSEASRFAEKIGLPFTRMITIHWEAAGVELSQMAKATGRFLGLLTKTIRRYDGQTAWAWVHEGGVHKGGHAHILAHIPSELMPIVRKRQRGWLKRITGNKYRESVIFGRPIGGHVGLERSNPALLAVNIQSALSYCMKGADKNAVNAYGLVKVEEGGLVIGKRCGVSQNIGPKARKSAVEDSHTYPPFESGC